MCGIRGGARRRESVCAGEGEEREEREEREEEEIGQGRTTHKLFTTMAGEEKKRYSDAELAEFKELILKKLQQARSDYESLCATITHTDDNDTEDTSPTFKVLEEGATTLSKEESARLASHQLKFIKNLEMALVRIENKTYGICKTTGQLIPKERLLRVPHATECIEAKEKRR